MERNGMKLPISVVALLALITLMALIEARRANNRLDKRDKNDKAKNLIMVKDMLDDLEYWANKDHPSEDDW
jgi:hypothetical protein